MITREQVQHIAKLSRIALRENEIEEFQRDLGEILQYFEILQNADIAVSFAKEERSSFGGENTSREDNAKKENAETIEKLMAMVPDTEQGYVRVPKIL